MVPDKQNPIWRTIVTNSDQYQFKALATKLMMMRVKMIVENENQDSEKNIEEAVCIAYDYFIKNQTILKGDINYLFNSKNGVSL